MGAVGAATVRSSGGVLNSISMDSVRQTVSLLWGEGSFGDAFLVFSGVQDFAVCTSIGSEAGIRGS